MLKRLVGRRLSRLSMIRVEESITRVGTLADAVFPNRLEA